MRAFKISFLTVMVIAFAGCGPSSEEKMKLEEQALLGSRLAVAHADSLLQLHYSMNATFEVDNALQTTLQLEHVCRNAGGYIENSTTTKNTLSSSTVQIAKDTSEVVSTYNYSTVLQLQVPVKNVNSFIDSVAGFATNLVVREITGKNLAANFAAANSTAQQLGNTYKEFQNDYPDSGPSKNNAEQQLDTKLSYLATKGQNKSELTELQLQKSYASIVLCFKDKEKIKYEKTVLPTLPIAYGSDFGSEVLAALSVGTTLVKNFFLFILKLWPILFLILFFARGTIKQLVAQVSSKSISQNSSHK